jgi:hypothetical protein
VRRLSCLGYIVDRIRLSRISDGVCVETGTSWVSSAVGRLVGVGRCLSGRDRCLGGRGIDVASVGVFIRIFRSLGMDGLSGRGVVGVALVELVKCTGDGFEIVGYIRDSMTSRSRLIEVSRDSVDGLDIERPVGCSRIRILKVALNAFNGEVRITRGGVLVRGS